MSKSKLEAGIFKKLFFGEFFSIALDAYLEFLVSSYLNMSAPKSTNDGEQLSIYLSYLCLIIVYLVVPATFYFLWNQNLHTWENEHFEKKWGVLYENCRLDSKITSMFFFVFVIRRILFVNISFLMNSTPFF